jgi:hypothetical protein
VIVCISASDESRDRRHCVPDAVVLVSQDVDRKTAMAPDIAAAF